LAISSTLGIFKIFTAKMYAGLCLCLLVAVLLLFLPVSCSDESSPILPNGVDSDCINYKDYLHIAGFCDTPGQAFDVALSGDYAYLAGGISGLWIVMRQCQP